MTQINTETAELGLARKLFWLAKHDRIFFSGYNADLEIWDEGVYPVINCNDIMVAGADAEQLSEEDLDLFIDLCKEYPQYAEYAWCIAKRNGKPWRMPLTEQEQAAVDYARQLLEG